MMHGPYSDIDRILPAELWIMIFVYLNPTELIRIMQVCTSFNQLARENQLWRPFAEKTNDIALPSSEAPQGEYYQQLLACWKKEEAVYPIDKKQFAQFPFVPVSKISLDGVIVLSVADNIQKVLRSSFESLKPGGTPILLLREQLFTSQLEGMPRYQVYCYNEKEKNWQLRVDLSMLNTEKQGITYVSCPLSYLADMLNEKPCERKYLEMSGKDISTLCFSKRNSLMRERDRLRCRLTQDCINPKVVTLDSDPVILPRTAYSYQF